ncbi:hypothetical protein ALC57_11457, partial [Trachymyrmex cornetzi]
LLGFAMAVVVARKRHSIRHLVGKSAIVRKGLERSFFFSFSRRLTKPDDTDDTDDVDVDVDVSCRAAVSHHRQLPETPENLSK